jgi:hypothetical protein
MAARQCPQCQARIPAVRVAAYSDSLECRGCSAPLEVSAAARYLATAAGLAAAAALLWWMEPSSRSLGWTVPVLAAFFTFSLVAPAVLMLIGDLVPRTVVAGAPVEEDVGGGHGGHH